MNDILFYVLAIAVCVFGLLTVLSRNVFHSAVWLATGLLSIAGIYFYLGAEFLGVIQVLVYVGGIISLFIFAIHLTAKIEDPTIHQTNNQVFLSSIAVFALFLFIANIVRAQVWPANPAMAQPLTIQQLGVALITTYALPFEYISITLLGAMVGAIVIGKIKK